MRSILHVMYQFFYIYFWKTDEIQFELHVKYWAYIDLH
jgi:hypothetical protein